MLFILISGLSERDSLLGGMKSLPYRATANEAFYTYFVAPFKNGASRIYNSGDEP